MESDKKIGIASSKILYFYEDNTIQYAGITYKPYYSRGRHYGYKEIDQTIDEVTETSYPHGACT
jgi:hypothetical protein